MTRATLNIPLNQLDAFCRQNGIRRLSLYGSALRDDFTADSDIDLLVEFEPDARTGLAFFRMQRELSAMFGRPVDLNTAADLSPYFRSEVLNEAKVIYDAA